MIWKASASFHGQTGQIHIASEFHMHKIIVSKEIVGQVVSQVCLLQARVLAYDVHYRQQAFDFGGVLAAGGRVHLWLETLIGDGAR